MYSNFWKRCTGYDLEQAIYYKPARRDPFLMELFMKARIAFYFAAVVALVLFLAAAVPSHATQHRDPALSPENMQKSTPAQSAKPTSPSDSNSTKARPAKSKKQSSGSHGSSTKPGR
jgi:hypothetical protein